MNRAARSTKWSVVLKDFKQCLPQFLDRLEVPNPQQVLFQSLDQPFSTTVPSGARTKASGSMRCACARLTVEAATGADVLARIANPFSNSTSCSPETAVQRLLTLIFSIR